MIAGSARGRMVLVVEPDLAFADALSALLDGDRVVAARSMEEASAIAEGRRVDVALVGPSFGTEEGAASATALRDADPTLLTILVADVPTNRVLRAALRAGLTDVLDAPVTARKLADVLSRTDAIDAARAVPIVLEPEPDAPLSHPAVASDAPALEAQPAAFGISHASAADGRDDGGVVVSFSDPSGESPQAVAPPPVEPSAPPPEEPAPPVTPAVAPAASEEPSPPETSEPIALPEMPAAPPLAPAVVPEPPATPQPGPLVAPAALDSQLAPPLPSELEPAVPPALEPPVPLEDAVYAPPSFPPYLPPETAQAQAGTMPADAPPMPGEPPPTAPPAGTVGPTSSHDEEVPLPRHRPGAGRVLTVMAGKGGSGKTITATNLAAALTEQVGEDKVVIVDADLQFGDVALLLQIEPTRTIVDAAAELDDLTEPRLDALLLRHESGLRVLPAPLLPAGGEKVRPKEVVRLVEMLREMFPFVVVDTAPIFDDGLITLLEHSDDVLLVVDMDLPSVKNAKIALDTLRAVGFDMSRIHLTVNRANSKARLDLAELERALGEEVAASIPSDRLIPQSVNEGVPAVAFSPRSRVAKAFHTLASLFREA